MEICQKLYTVPAVLQEIRDAKARQHLDTLPFTLQCREASPEGIKAVVEFARQTGDYSSLSSVDLQVPRILITIFQREGCCGDMSHVRKTPKRTVGLGKIESLGKSRFADEKKRDNDEQVRNDHIEIDPSENLHGNSIEEQTDIETSQTKSKSTSPTPESWAALVNPSVVADTGTNAPEKAPNVSFAKMEISKKIDLRGQFSDAENDGDDDSLGSFSDEECEAYIIDPQEVNQGKRAGSKEGRTSGQELPSQFPSLAEAATVPYEGSDDDKAAGDEHLRDPSDRTRQTAVAEAEDEERKRQALQPVTKSGKLYNSFRKYGDLMKPKPVKKQAADAATSEQSLKVSKPTSSSDGENAHGGKNQSKIIGGMSFAGQGDDVEDDGEGWISNTRVIQTMKAAVGALDPTFNPDNLDNKRTTANQFQGPAKSQRAACTTTDFAMQNVILQMNLELLSVDGMKVRKLKNWVTRCGACFTVYTNSDNTSPLGKRLFCERCGSDMMQRIAASVDGKTGRLRLHLSKKYKHNLRGTKFSLPKPGTGNRFQGDLLLCEDQLMMGAWNQKLKMRSGGKARNAAQSMFGADIAANVGCHANAMNVHDIRVGFGRRNPNAARGRERRGKKKKSSDKACGLRRY